MKYFTLKLKQIRQTAQANVQKYIFLKAFLFYPAFVAAVNQNQSQKF